MIKPSTWQPKTFKALAEQLQAKGIRLEDVLQQSQIISSEKLAAKFGLQVEEQSMLYQALQLKAQAAVASIRSSAEDADFTEEDIEAEIQAARNKRHDAHRS